jgi:hypothetical protein
MATDGSRQLREDVELLKLARARHREQTRNGAFTVIAASPKTDFPPLHRVAQRWFAGRQIRDLMVSRVADRVSRVQAPVPTGTGDQNSHPVHTLGGNQQLRVNCLPARLASTLAATPFALPVGEVVGGGRLRRRRRILLWERELTLKSRNLSGMIGGLPCSLGQPDAVAQSHTSDARRRHGAAVRSIGTPLPRYVDRITFYSPVNCGTQ